MVGCPLKGLWKKERKLKTGLRQIRKRDNINIRTDEYMRHSLSAISENNLEKEKGSWWLKQLGNCMWVFNGSQKEVTHFYNITGPQCFVDVCLCVSGHFPGVNLFLLLEKKDAPSVRKSYCPQGGPCSEFLPWKHIINICKCFLWL